MWSGEVMVKSGERGIACGLGHEKVIGLGHMLIGDPTAEIGLREWHSMERKAIGEERENCTFPIFWLGIGCGETKERSIYMIKSRKN